MKKLIITVGASCSGKSSWAEEYCRNRSNIVDINRDNVRFNLIAKYKSRDWSKYKFTKSNENKVSEFCTKQAEEASRLGYDIVVSDTNLTPKYRERWKQFAEDNGYSYKEAVFIASWDELAARNNQREGGIPQSILWQQYLRMNKYLGRKTYTPDETKPRAFLCDIDGTLADFKGVRGPYEWDKVSKDSPRNVVIAMALALVEEGCLPIFLSGRDGCCYQDTYDWIMHNMMQWYLPEDGGFHLFMREEGDTRKDTIIKEEIFWKYVEPGFNIVACLDDRPSVVRMWNEIEIPNVISVADPLKEF